MPNRTSNTSKLVDYQSHWYMRSYLESILGRTRHPRAERRRDGGYLFDPRPDGPSFPLAAHFVDLDLQLAGMDDLGIDAVVTSPSLLGEVADLELPAAREAIDFINEAGARAQRDHPGRIFATAMLPVQDLGASIETVDRAVELGLQAVCMVSNAGGRPIASEKTLPLYKCIEGHGLPIILHPASQSLAAPSGIDTVADVGVGWMFDTSAAALSLITSGTLDACPNLRIVHPHLGGVIPFIDGRLAVTLRLWAAEQLAHPLTHYLRNHFYIDSVSQTPGALQLAIECYGVDRVLFASDYPWIPRANARPYVERNANEADVAAILFDNQLPFVRPVEDELGATVITNSETITTDERVEVQR
jgi:aminocarboxymuconate-semialdehyde decarboxylase